VKSLLSFAHGLGYLPFNVGKALRNKARETARRCLTTQQLCALINTTRGADRTSKRNYTLLRVLDSSGCRSAEIRALAARNVLERGAHRVSMTVRGKGDRIRTILLGKKVSRLLKSWIQYKGVVGDDVVFATPGGRVMHSSTLCKLVKKAAADAELDVGFTITPHAFRHCFASHSLDRGTPVHVVSRDLGHKSLATTSIYVDAAPTMTGADALDG